MSKILSEYFKQPVESEIDELLMWMDEKKVTEIKKITIDKLQIIKITTKDEYDNQSPYLLIKRDDVLNLLAVKIWDKYLKEVPEEITQYIDWTNYINYVVGEKLEEYSEYLSELYGKTLFHIKGIEIKNENYVLYDY